ncbi:hypothetical protein V5F34_00770 [Xanthobacter autotrophicus]|uniref:hypothetical protein n=1 Tax=Xanthobacter autotrophicus TaxID=280 RepID=UPI0037283BFE
MTETDEKVARLGVKFKAPPAADGQVLRLVDKYDSAACNHHFVHYLIREGETEVECGNCGTRLDPMFVLKKLAHKESNWNRTREVYQEEMARLKERQRTTCQHCGKMTRISRR